MAIVKGSLLVTAEAMELAGIPADCRDQAVSDFHRMKTEAERCHDHFYAMAELYGHQFSYGDFYSGYKEGVELINRNFFLQTTCMRLGENNPIQGTVWKNTEIYYKYCKEAVAIVDADKLMS